MIGIFDSGLGGLSILQALIQELPNYDYIYLGDNARAPYGDKAPEQIYQHTLESVEYLFRKKCNLVILACNTASAIALQKIQQEVLPKKYPNKKVLGIILPSIEEITGKGENNNSQSTTSSKPIATNLGIIATTQTVNSKAYLKEIQKRSPSIKITQLACPRLAPLVESNTSSSEMALAIQSYLEQLPLTELDSLLLGCTHYQIIAKQIKAQLPKHIRLYSQPKIIARSLKEYILKHTQLDLSQNATRTLLCTGNPNLTQTLATKFLKNKIVFKKVRLKQ